MSAQMNAPWEPEGIRFFDKTSGRDLLLVAEGQPHAGWLCYRHREGQWVTLREATDEDRFRIAAGEGMDAVRILAELNRSEVDAISEFAAKIKSATALVVHPDDLEDVRSVVAVLGRPDLELFSDSRLERGISYAIDQDAIDPYRKTTP